MIKKNFLKDFYDQLDNDTFFGESFEDEDNLPTTAPELSSDDDLVDELKLDDVVNVVEENHIPSLPQKSGFANLDD